MSAQEYSAYLAGSLLTCLTCDKTVVLARTPQIHDHLILAAAYETDPQHGS